MKGAEPSTDRCTGSPRRVAAPVAPTAWTAQGACDSIASRGSCTAYAGVSDAGLAQLQSACASTGGSFVASCPAEGRVGTCIIPTPAYLSGLNLYAPSWTDADGRSLCGNGAWVGVNAPAETAAQATVSCSMPWNSSCVDTSGPMTPTLRTAVERRCTSDGADLLSAACPASGRVGTCTTRPGELVWETRYYYPQGPSTVGPYCADQGGSWTDG